ncbi:MAG: efflux RND transporter permease subunit [Gemmatimonadota bacterium]
MSWASLSLARRHAVFAASIAVVVFGTLAWFRLPISLFPDTAPPLVNIVTAQPGASALDVAKDLSEPIEEEVATLDGIARVTSLSQDGLSVVTAEFEYGRDVDLAAVDVQNAVDRIRERLPAGTARPRVVKFSTADRPVITLAVRGSEAGADPAEARRIAENHIRPLLQRVPGVASVDVFGGDRSRIDVEVDRSALEAAGLVPGDVVRALREGNVTRPGGTFESGGREVLLRIDHSPLDAADLALLPVAYREGQRVLVGDVARVREGTADRRSAFRHRGTDAVALEVLQRQDANTVGVVHRVEALLPELRDAFPDLEIEVASEEASFTDLVVRNMGMSIVAALLLAAFVVFLFLGSLKASAVISISMPMSFLLTFALMWATGMELNLVTLSAVILAVGIVVDSSVVVLENMTRHRREMGLDEEAAAVRGTDEVFGAVLAGILTTVIVLVPFLFLEGFVGQVFGPLSLTLIFAFASSLLAAVTLVPLLGARILAKDVEEDGSGSILRRPLRAFESGMDGLRGIYLGALRWALTRRAVTLGAAVLLLAAGTVSLLARGMEVLPRLDSGSFYVTVETEPETSSAGTRRVVEQVEELLAAEPHVVGFTARVGFEPGAVFLGDAGAMGVQQAFLSVELVSRKERPETIWEIQDRVREGLAGVPGIRTAVVKEMGGTAKATTAAPLNVRISGSDPAVLDELSKRVLERARRVPGAVNMYRRWTLDRPDLRLRTDPLRAAELGLTSQQVVDATYGVVEGTRATTWTARDGTELPVVVRYPREGRSDLESILQVHVRPGLSLGEVVTAAYELAPNLVTRENLLPTADVAGFHDGRAFSHVVADLERELREIQVPPGYELEVTGEMTDLQESRGQMVFALLLAILAVYLLLVAQFRSFVHPLTVMLAVPLVVVGVAAALIVAGQVISMAVLMSLVLLVGIAVNNSIILLDFVLQRRGEGSERRAAVLDAVSTRFRPVMMTTFSTVAGMIPLALEWSLGAERFSPMAVAIIGGLTASSLLTLLVVPVFYTVLDDVEMRFRPPAGSG